MERIKVLVTGGTGFLGSEIVKALVEARIFDITALDLNPPALGTGTFSQVRYVRADILHIEELQRVFNEVRPKAVIHTVGVYPLGQARYSKKGWKEVWSVNVTGTENVVEASKECGVRALVYTSSVTVLLDELDRDFINVNETWSTGKAGTTYGQSKSTAEDHVLSKSTQEFPTCALRSSVIFGPHDPAVIPTLRGCINRGETPFILGDGTNLQDFVYVSNVADAHVLAVRNLLGPATAAGEAFFITNGEPVTARDMCLAVWKEFGHVPPFQVRIPKGVAWWLGLGAEWVSWITGMEGSFSRGVILDATQTRYVSIAKARRVLGYEPRVRLPEALSISCQHFEQQRRDQAKK